MKLKIKKIVDEIDAIGKDVNGEGDSVRTVIVGVRLDPQSRELLTWSLVNVVDPGDRVIALHVPSKTEDLDHSGMSSLSSLFKSFESVLSVYEDFCNLKQIDLKLKICRGSSIRKVIVREAKLLSAAKVIVGVRINDGLIRSSTSVAKYCARKLPSSCSVLAVNNGKVIFPKESISTPLSVDISVVENLPCRTWSLNHESFIRRTSDDQSIASSMRGDCYFMNSSTSFDRVANDSVTKLNDRSSCYSPMQTCSLCSSSPTSLDQSPSSEDKKSSEWFKQDIHEKSVVVGEENLEVATSSISSDLIPVCENVSGKCVKEYNRFKLRNLSVVQWAMSLPTRFSSVAIHPNNNSIQSNSLHDQTSLNKDCGALIPDNIWDSPIFEGDSDAKLQDISKELESLRMMYAYTCTLFRYQDLLKATLNFSLENLIGSGGSSQVYKGCLPNGRDVAVKVLKFSEDSFKEFMLEIEIITALKHKNIISMRGFGFEDNKFFLVYDLLPRGSLEDNLHGKKDQNTLRWEERYKVAIGVAEALDYLHTNTKPVIHMDVKSSNVLLTDDLEPQLSDFGLATWALPSSSYITRNDVAGTFGYLAPEYFMFGKVTEKVDVYAFGVILLELLSGRKPIDSLHPMGQKSLVMWAKPILQYEKLNELLDPNLGENYDVDQAERMALAASLCIKRTPELRPGMDLVRKFLQGDQDAIKLVKSQENSSEEFHCFDDDIGSSASDIQSHLNLALLDIEDDLLSLCRMDQIDDCSIEPKLLNEEHLLNRF